MPITGITRTFLLRYSVCVFLLLFGCPSKQEGAVQGSVVPARPGVRVAASQSGKPVSAVDADSLHGSFSIPLPPGTYDISVSAPDAPFPVKLSGVTVDPGKTSSLPPIEISSPTGSIMLSGKISPTSRATVTLLYEGRERAALQTSAEGKYEFSGLPAGRYIVQASSPGYAVTSEEISVTGDQEASRNMKLLYLSPIDGVDWNLGIIRATGRGKFPSAAANPTIMREMAKRAALSDGERNLLRIVEQIKIDANHDIKSSMTASSFSERIHGFIRGFKVVAEHDVDGGIEVELELPLTGTNGLTGILTY